MSGAWRSLAAAFDARTRRERIAIALLAVAGIPLAVLFAWVEPQWRVRTALSAEIDQLRRTQSSAPPMADPNHIARQELQALASQLRAAQEALAEHSRTLVAPSQMAGLLEELLRRAPGLRMVALRSLASEPVKGPSPGATAVLYRHGVEIEVEGSWSDLQRYLESLERAPRRLLWDRMDLRARQHPQVAMKLTVYTLSTDPAWLQL